ncbi:MAG: hypothetical protein FWF08_03690 [Oscillospiraceae bacterium]|nr:hypothetical protein [Oscillospiraceae bacterium]
MFKIKKNPKIEEVMKKTLKGETLNNALGFIAFLRESGFKTEDKYGNNFYYMSEPTCILLCFENENYPDGEWGVYNSPICEYEGIPLDEDLKEFSRENVRICKGECGCRKWPRGGDQTVFGKKFEGVCSSVIMYQNPDAEAIEKIKKIMEHWKLIIADSKKR